MSRSAIGRERVLLFDWHADGHHPLYLGRFADALQDVDVVVAAPEAAWRSLSDQTTTVALPSRPPDQPNRRHTNAVAREELLLLQETARATGATRIVHMYADPILPQWSRMTLELPPTTICVFFAASHYPRVYRSSLTHRETARELRTEAAVRIWRRRRYAASILALDEANATRWNRPERPAYWLPEPPVARLNQPTSKRAGAVLYGALAARKGFNELAVALSLGAPPAYPVTIAGPVRPEYEAEFQALREALVRRRVDLRIRLHHHGELAGLDVLAAANCALLPYRRHTGMSRVLLEAASVGTRVVVSDFGLLADLTRKFGLGVVVRAEEPAQLRAGIDALAAHPPSRAEHERLALFAARYAQLEFTSALRNAIGLRGLPARQHITNSG